MSAKAYSVRQIQAELDRVSNGGEIDRAGYCKWLQLAALQLEDWRQAFNDQSEERTDFAKRAIAAETMLASLGQLLEVGFHAARSELTALQAIEFARDKAPFRNLMATMYGLNEVGAELPKRRSRRAKA